MPEIGTSGSMSEDGKRSVAEWPKLPRPSSTLPSRLAATQDVCGFRSETDMNRQADRPHRSRMTLNRSQEAKFAALPRGHFRLASPSG